MKERETPAVIYNTIKRYRAIRSKTQINHFLSLGLRLSYDRVLEMTKELCYIQTKHHINTNVFTPSPSKKSLFTVLAKDNLDFNDTSSTTVQHFHGTSMTTMQFISEENLGDEKLWNTDIEFTSNMTVSHQKKVLQITESYSYANVEQINVWNTSLYSPYVKADIIRYNDNGNYIKSEKCREIE